MKILHLVSAKIWGGGEQYVYNLASVQKEKHTLYFWINNKNPDIPKFFTKFGNVEAVPMSGLQKNLGLLKLIKYVKDHHIEVICIHSGSVALMACLVKKFIPNLQIIFFKHNMIRTKYDGYHRWILSMVDHFVCVSKVVYNAQTNNNQIAEANKFHLIYSGVDTSKYLVENPSISDNENNNTTESFKIGYAGRIIENKGILILLEAAKQLVEEGLPLTVYLAGPIDESFQKKLKTYLTKQKASDFVTLLGYQQNIVNFYKSLDVYVAPSIVPEAFGLSIVEAMCSGVAVIASDSGAQKELIQTMYDGIIIPSNNSKDLKEQLKFLYLNPEKRKDLAKNAQQCASEKFSLQRMCEEIDLLIE